MQIRSKEESIFDQTDEAHVLFCYFIIDRSALFAFLNAKRS